MGLFVVTDTETEEAQLTDVKTNKRKSFTQSLFQTVYFCNQTCLKPTIFTRSDIIANFENIVNRIVEHVPYTYRSRCCLQ